MKVKISSDNYEKCQDFLRQFGGARQMLRFHQTIWISLTNVKISSDNLEELDLTWSTYH
jgi:hypothetical protein